MATDEDEDDDADEDDDEDEDEDAPAVLRTCACVLCLQIGRPKRDAHFRESRAKRCSNRCWTPQGPKRDALRIPPKSRWPKRDARLLLRAARIAARIAARTAAGLLRVLLLRPGLLLG